MGNSVAPTVQVSQVTNSADIPATSCSYLIPEFQAKTVEVGTNVAGIRIPAIQLAMKREFGAENRLQWFRSNRTNDVVDCFGMQVTAESLKL